MPKKPENEEEFQRMIKGVNLSPKEKDVLREDLGLTPLEEVTKTPTLRNYLQLSAWSKLSQAGVVRPPEQTQNLDQKIDDRADELIEKAARQLTGIDMINGKIVQLVVDRVFEDFPKPDNLGERLHAKIIELYRKDGKKLKTG